MAFLWSLIVLAWKKFEADSLHKATGRKYMSLRSMADDRTHKQGIKRMKTRRILKKILIMQSLLK